jgi:copper(I)-binding protein
MACWRSFVQIRMSDVAAACRIAFLSLLLGISGAARAATGGLAVTNVWARATPAGVDVGGAYFTIVNRGKQPDVLLSLASPAASMVALHRTTMESGLSRMRPAGEVVIAPGQTVTAGPGGLHVMLMDLNKPLVAGTRVPLVMTFRLAGAITVQMDIQAATTTSHSAHAGH